VLIFVFLDFDTVGVVGTHFVKGKEVQHHQAQQHYGQRHYVQCEEAVQGGLGNQVVTANPLNQGITHHGDGAEQGYDHLRTPVGHLAPGQYITHEGLGHQYQVNRHTKNPHQLARRLVGAIHQTAEHVQIDHHEESGGTG